MRWALAIGRTPRELLASVTSEDLTEMLAYSQLEPFGSLREDRRAGEIASIVANVNRDPKKSKPFYPYHFFPELNPKHQEAATGPVLVDDPKKQADLIRSQVFGLTPGARKAGDTPHG